MARTSVRRGARLIIVQVHPSQWKMSPEFDPSAAHTSSELSTHTGPCPIPGVGSLRHHPPEEHTMLEHTLPPSAPASGEPASVGREASGLALSEVPLPASAPRRAGRCAVPPHALR